MKSPQTAIVPQRHVNFLAILTCLLTYFSPLWMGASPLWGQDTERVKEITEWLNIDKVKQNRIRTQLNRARESAKAEKKHVNLELDYMFLTNKDLKKIIFLITEGSEWKGLISKITTLGLGANKLNNLPSTLGRFSSLKDLRVRFNRIKKIPVEITKLKELESLDLDYNKIMKLPREMAKLKKLKDLKLDFNQVESFPLEIASLEKLDFGRCFYTTSKAHFTEPPLEGWESLSQAMASSEGKCRWKSDVREKIYTFLAALRHQYQDFPQCYLVMKTLTKEHLSPMLPSNDDEHFELYVGGKKVKHLYVHRAFFQKELLALEEPERPVKKIYIRVDASAISGLGHRLIVNFLKQNPNFEIYYD